MNIKIYGEDESPLESFDNFSDNSTSIHPLAVGLRQYNGDPDVWEKLARELDPYAVHPEEWSHISVEDAQKITELHHRKVEAINEIPPRYQRMIRTSINQIRKIRKQPEIHYSDINPMNSSYNQKYAQLIIDKYNADIDHSINAIYEQKVYEHELQKVQHCTKEQLQKKVKKIPHEVQSEIVQSLKLNPQSITAQKKDVQQKIIATFNTFY